MTDCVEFECPECGHTVTVYSGDPQEVAKAWCDPCDVEMNREWVRC